MSGSQRWGARWVAVVLIWVMGLASGGCSNAPLAGVLDCCFPSKLEAPPVRPPRVGPAPLGPPTGGAPTDRLPPPADLTPPLPKG
jgi:hypothetical protein